MTTRARSTLRNSDDSGATAAEYALLIAGIAIITFAAIFFLGQAVNSPFEDAGSSISASQ